MSNKENAIVYCEGSFNTPNGKTAHGLVRFTERFNIVAVIDSKFQGADSGSVLDGKPNNIPVVKSLDDALIVATDQGKIVSSYIIGLAPDGGRLPGDAFTVIEKALKSRLNIVSGLHDFLSEDERLGDLAAKYNCTITDIRKPPDRSKLHFFSGKIEEVNVPKVAVLGTDSAIGKRTTAWLVVHAFRQKGRRAELIGTGQTAWMQGARYSIVLDSLVNDFVSGEIEHAIYEAWRNEHPEVIVLEGQGSLLNPAYPGGFELIAAGRPDYIVLQHAPRRRAYDGFPGYPIQSIQRQIDALEIISGKKVAAIALNHEGMRKDEIKMECNRLYDETGVPAFDPLEFGATDLTELLISKFGK